MKNTNKVKLILMAMAMMLINTSALAQVKVMPISKLNDGYLVLQDNKVPIYESIQKGDFSLFDEQWCLSEPSQISNGYIYDGGLNENLNIALIDNQLVIGKDDVLKISNGFFKLKNLMGEVRTFKRVGYKAYSDFKILTELPLHSYANKLDAPLQRVEFMLAEDADDSNEVLMTNDYREQKWISKSDALRLLEESWQADGDGMVDAIVDGVRMRVHKSSLSAIINMAVAIEVNF